MSNKLNIEPRVRNLLSYLADIEKGLFQIPAFQRDFVWSRDDIKDLFDSIKNGYPIGSVLFWRPEAPVGDIKETIGSYYIPPNKEIVYILDGFQRLSTLFGCLTNPSSVHLARNMKEWEEYFNLYYDLEEEGFIYLRQKTLPAPFQVPLFILINSSNFRQYARKEFELLNDERRIELYYDRADKLSRTFLEYQIASIDINNATIEEAVEIFSRINSKGQDISLDWMANALSIKDGFRFGSEIDTLLEDLKQFNFEKIDRNVIFRCIQSSFGKLYIDNHRIEALAKRSDFREVTIATLPKIKEAVKFLFEELYVVDSRLLPYNMQLIFIMDFFKKLEQPSDYQKSELKKWFWITTYSNYFTIYSLANQRRAFDHFHRFLDGIEATPVFNDKPALRFSVAQYPEKINLGSVRAKALTLFLLQYSHTGVPLHYLDVGAFKHYKIFPSRNEPENFIPIIFDSKGISNLSTSIILHKQKDVSNLFYSSAIEDERLFINAEMVDLFLNFEQDRLLKTRKNLIQIQERIFTEEVLNLEYKY